MTNVTVFVGLDYHQDAIQVCILDPAGQVLSNRPCRNDTTALCQRVAAFGDRAFAAIECCTGASSLADELAALPGWSIDLAHPGYVARLKQSPDKTDLQDAHLLADLERVGYLPRVWLAPPELRDLRQLVRYRQQLVSQRRNAKLRVGALLREARVVKPEARPWTKAWLAWVRRVALGEHARWVLEQHLRHLEELTRDIRAAEERITQATAGDAVVQRLLRLKGVGPVTAATLRAEIGRFDRFRNGKQLARFCGLSPRNASSGSRQADAGLVKAGNPELRAVLIELAHRLVRYEARWAQLGRKLKASGKPGSLVAAAVANRWMRWLHHEMTMTTAA
jgi:transposase